LFYDLEIFGALLMSGKVVYKDCCSKKLLNISEVRKMFSETVSSNGATTIVAGEMVLCQNLAFKYSAFAPLKIAK